MSSEPKWTAATDTAPGLYSVHIREAAHDLYAALVRDEALISKAQNLLRMYLEPGERSIQSEKDCVNALLQLFDGPEQRETQRAARAALAKARGEA